MRIVSLALGGCLKALPVEFGITEDTGGHIAYALGAAMALAARADVTHVELVTRMIDDTVLGAAYARELEPVGDKLAIRRIDSGNRAYLSKEASTADRPAFTRALLAWFETLDHRPDLLHAHFADAAEVAMAVRERFGIPFIYTAHSLGIDKARCAALPCGDMDRRIAMETRAVIGADAIIASSRDEAERQLMLYDGADAARIHCVPPGASIDGGTVADPDRARALLAPFLRDPSLPMLLAIARPVAKKNLEGLVDLYAADPDLRARANLVIVAGLRDAPDSGEAEQREVIAGLLDRMDRHDLYGRLALPKRHDRADVAALYALARDTGGVFVNPAWTEPYGLTLTEAASHGLPVVATSHGGPSDIVATLGHGVVADPHDPPAFAGAIASLLDDRARWQAASAAGRRNAQAMTWDAYAARFVDIARTLHAPAITPASPEHLLLSDIDNTLTGCRAGAAELCAVLADRGDVGFGVATGRSLQEAQRLLHDWGYPDPMLLITSVGCEIYWRRGARLFADADFARWIDHGWDRGAIAAVAATLPEMRWQPAVEQRRHKLSWFAEDPATPVLLADRLTTAGIAARVVWSHGDLLDVLPARAGKGAAMLWAANRMGLPIDCVHAAGDSGNDIDMLERCPNAIIVANHDDQLAALAARPGMFVSKSRHAGGIVEALEQRGLTGQRGREAA
ncbi:HAD-IIB family hydrolase [Sphingomonas sp. S1-29]|uniref:HAD-IIB family hydrolase n=1 Tax=Sphingomonas sp. S1-29 TaxID=2991074 RepID=UPI002240ADD8|nr:HAD-IIB family hydrolase [Sphingomonas sp. S1-29]UZK68962.1 HAD-IIB family hydrolase [Sphingomonas sp. S1-29]